MTNKIKKALFIGIDYLNTPNELSNCRNDAIDMHKLVTNKFGIDEYILLTDDALPDKKPTRENILKWFKWLSNNNNKNDNLWLHYSGHGGYVVDLSKDEKSGYDDTLIPVDFMTSGQIIDDDINTLICKPIALSGSNLFFHADSCHSGTVADLKYTLSESSITNNLVGTSKYIYIYDNYGRRTKKLVSDTSKIKHYDNVWEFKENGYASLNGSGQIIQLSGCMDNQTSADGFNGMQNGAMTGSVITVLNMNKNMTWSEFLIEVRKLLKNYGFSQIPQLSFNKKIGLNDKYFNY